MFICHRLRCGFYLSVSIILFIGKIRCEFDFIDDNDDDDDAADADVDGNSNYNWTESNEILVTMNGTDEDYTDLNESICSESCKNGYCIDTDTCLCHNGYQPSHVDKFVCEPICGDADIENIACTNGVCIAPQLCECLDGYVLSKIHPFTCITHDVGKDNEDDDDEDQNKRHEFRDTSYVFWVLMSALLIFIAVTIIVLIVWITYERKTTYVVDENVNGTIVMYNVPKNNLDNEVIICTRQ